MHHCVPSRLSQETLSSAGNYTATMKDHLAHTAFVVPLARGQPVTNSLSNSFSFSCCKWRHFALKGPSDSELSEPAPSLPCLTAFLRLCRHCIIPLVLPSQTTEESEPQCAKPILPLGEQHLLLKPSTLMLCSVTLSATHWCSTAVDKCHLKLSFYS